MNEGDRKISLLVRNSDCLINIFIVIFKLEMSLKKEWHFKMSLP